MKHFKTIQDKFKKMYYFPNSKKLEKYWFHRLVFPLYNVSVLLYIVFIIIFVFSSLSFSSLYFKAYYFSNELPLFWCESNLEKIKQMSRDDEDFDPSVYSSDITYDQERIIKSLPYEKAKKYASTLNGCLYHSENDSYRLFTSNNSRNTFYEVGKYLDSADEKIGGDLFAILIVFVGYIFGAFVPGIVYKYILYIFFGKKVESLIN